MLKVNRALIYHVDNEMHWNNVAINNTNCITKSTYFLSPFCKFFLITDSFRLALCSLLLLRCYMCGAYVHLILLFFRDFMKFSLFLIVCTVLLSVSYFFFFIFFILFLHSLDLIIYLENFSYHMLYTLLFIMIITFSCYQLYNRMLSHHMNLSIN